MYGLHYRINHSPSSSCGWRNYVTQKIAHNSTRKNLFKKGVPKENSMRINMEGY